jgi:hypothetical protein
MKIEQPKKQFQPITITLETEREAEILMLLCACVAGEPDGARSVSTKVYETLMQLGVDYRDANFNLKYVMRGRIIIDDLK